MPSIKENLELVRENIANAALKYGRKADDVKLLAVSKTFPASDVAEAFACGQTLFGENRVQELELKAPLLPSEIRWHLIGHLQSNKAKKAALSACTIHSVDSEKLIEKLSKTVLEAGLALDIMLEVNVTDEDSKSGLRSESDILRLAEIAIATKGIRLTGLMTMAELDATEKRLRETFSMVRTLRDKIEREFSITIPELSMGMSSDYEQAIAEGSTIVRIGTAIFGGRDYTI